MRPLTFSIENETKVRFHSGCPNIIEDQLSKALDLIQFVEVDKEQIWIIKYWQKYFYSTVTQYKLKKKCSMLVWVFLMKLVKS